MYRAMACKALEQIIQAIALAEEVSTAVPSVAHYETGDLASVQRLLAEGLRRKTRQAGPAAVVYAAENHPAAARQLAELVLGEAGGDAAAIEQCVQFVDTVIGKMSGAVRSGDGLAGITIGGERAFLVEEFNQIFIESIDLPQANFQRGLSIFEEKAQLQPFEATKLYAHNAAHALAAYMARLASVCFLCDLRQSPEAMLFLRGALVEEAGVALCRTYAGIDPLFTSAGFADYADDLLRRMTSPFLKDRVAWVARDPARKLGWQDRLIGALRLALTQGMHPMRLAVGAAAALEAYKPGSRPVDVLPDLWSTAAPDPSESQLVLEQVEAGQQRLQAWQLSGCRDWGALISATGPDRPPSNGQELACLPTKLWNN